MTALLPNVAPSLIVRILYPDNALGSIPPEFRPFEDSIGIFEAHLWTPSDTLSHKWRHDDFCSNQAHFPQRARYFDVRPPRIQPRSTRDAVGCRDLQSCQNSIEPGLRSDHYLHLSALIILPELPFAPPVVR